MEKVVIIANTQFQARKASTIMSPVTEKMVTAFKQAILNNSSLPVKVEVIPANLLSSGNSQLDTDVMYCPLTIQLPPWFEFPGKTIYQLCNDIQGRRKWVEHNLTYKTSIGESWVGNLWLPIILSGTGPIYGEIIGEGAIPNSYQQPTPLPDAVQKSLYNLANQLLEVLAAVPSVYLLQFSLLDKKIVFDRIWPFPAAPAIASLNQQKPDLFTCHWYCLKNQPINIVL